MKFIVVTFEDLNNLQNVSNGVANPVTLRVGLGDSRNPTHRDGKCWVTLSLTQLG